jgi:hypothetical protein
MALITAGGIGGLAALLWKHRKIPWSFCRWATGQQPEARVGQVWAFARISPLESSGKSWHTFEITEIRDDQVFYISNWMPDYPDQGVDKLDNWTPRMKSMRGWIYRDKGDIENKYFGDAAFDPD